MKLRSEYKITLADGATLAGDSIVAAAREALQVPSDSLWSDSELFTTHTTMFATPHIGLTNDYLMEWSNYQSILEDMGREYPGDVSPETFGHWTYARFVCIKVRVVDAEGYITAAFVDALEIQAHLTNNYPIWDEDQYLSLQHEIETEDIEEFATDNDIPVKALYEVMDTEGVYYHLGEGWDIGEEELLAKVRAHASTWDAHYSSAMGHYPEDCYYCERSEGLKV